MEDAFSDGAIQTSVDDGGGLEADSVEVVVEVEVEVEPAVVQGVLYSEPEPVHDDSGARFLAELREAAGSARRSVRPPPEDDEAQRKKQQVTNARDDDWNRRHAAQAAAEAEDPAVQGPVFEIAHPMAPAGGLATRDMVGFLRRRDVGMDFSVNDGTRVYPATALGAVLALDHLTLFPGLGDPPRHQGQTHTVRMTGLLTGYAQSRATGVLSVFTQLGNYSAWYLVDGGLQYVCMNPNQEHLLDILQIHCSVAEEALNTAIVQALASSRGLFVWLMEHGLLPRERLDALATELLQVRLDRVMRWGNCRFEFRPGLVLPYELPVSLMPLTSVAGGPSAAD